MIYSLIAVGLVFLGAEGDVSFPLFPIIGLWPTLAVILALIVLPWVAEPALQRIEKRGSWESAPSWLRGHSPVHVAILLVFVFLVLFSAWPTTCYGWPSAPYQKIAADWIMLSPFFAATILGYWTEARVILQKELGDAAESSGLPRPRKSERWQIAVFQIRHQLLAVAVPLLTLLASANLTKGYESTIISLARGFTYAPEFLLGTAAVAVYLGSPLLLKKVWSTEPLPKGVLRTELESLCLRIGLSYRDILVWKTGRRVINAAVMGLFGTVRYILLSDAMIEQMSPLQIRAVFGHEAGHVRHRHMESFLLFALLSTLSVSGVLQQIAVVFDPLPGGTVEAMGAGLTAIIWLLGFGWISRRFERQADLYGCACVTPRAEDCRLPCGLHGDAPVERSSLILAVDAQMTSSAESAPSSRSEPKEVCATAGVIFAGALHRVAILNGIPIHEPSWRHSSIASRMRFIGALTDDPARARAFQRGIAQTQWGLLVGAIAASALALWALS